MALRCSKTYGFTLIELTLAAVTLIVAIAAILGAFLGQQVLNEHARNLSLAIQDANRVVEQIRQQNSGAGCATPSAKPTGFAGWEDWLASPAGAGGGGGKSIQPDPATNELVVVTCQDRTGTVYCNTTTPQVSANEWTPDNANPNTDPLRLTVAICWRHRNRVIGECDANLVPQDGVNGPNNSVGVIESPAMVTTLVTCRG